MIPDSWSSNKQWHASIFLTHKLTFSILQLWRSRHMTFPGWPGVKRSTLHPYVVHTIFFFFFFCPQYHLGIKFSLHDHIAFSQSWFPELKFRLDFVEEPMHSPDGWSWSFVYLINVGRSPTVSQALYRELVIYRLGFTYSKLAFQGMLER